VPAVESDTDQIRGLQELPWGPAPEWTPGERLERRYNELLSGLMADYEPSYSPYEDDPYGGPSYGTASVAEEAAAYYLAEAETARAELQAAQIALQEQAGYVAKLHAELDGTRPWRRHRREQLRGRIVASENVLDDRHGNVSRLDSLADLASDHHGDAVWAARELRRYERALNAAEDAAARAMGWRPGLPANASAIGRPHALGPGRRAVVASGKRTYGARVPLVATDPSGPVVTTPPPVRPPQQGGPVAHL
jgi:hypothetical protein